ncbi:jg16913 [Pararge aegeria aegeria]|uniref:Jg16913 protein n=1 Tax=Pararge aegeria aegeria TaxID=348720 RepID=A0A8S4SQN8_9NEOP|nr:jg16913 [Pararge aegeria aegeria]
MQKHGWGREQMDFEVPRCWDSDLAPVDPNEVDRCHLTSHKELLVPSATRPWYMELPKKDLNPAVYVKRSSGVQIKILMDLS